MASRLTTFGNDLYTGKLSVKFVGQRKLWYSIAAVLILLSVLIPLVRGFNFGIEFRGGSQFAVSSVSQPSAQPGIDAVAQVAPEAVARVTVVGDDGVRVQTDQLQSAESNELSRVLADAYGVAESEVTSSFIGATWGADVTRQALVGLGVFLVLAAIVIAIYFRTWKMSVAAMATLLVDLTVTIGVYATVGFEVTPAAMIGLLTILSFSLYDKIVVFDKVRENTTEDLEAKRTFAENVNLAVNQTLVRSINTNVVAVLPIAAILFIGAGALGAATLRDISLALLVGTIVGTWSSLFLAAPFYSQLREGEAEIRRRDEKILKDRERAGAVAPEVVPA